MTIAYFYLARPLVRLFSSDGLLAQMRFFLAYLHTGSASRFDPVPGCELACVIGGSGWLVWLFDHGISQFLLRLFHSERSISSYFL